MKVLFVTCVLLTYFTTQAFAAEVEGCPSYSFSSRYIEETELLEIRLTNTSEIPFTIYRWSLEASLLQYEFRSLGKVVQPYKRILHFPGHRFGKFLIKSGETFTQEVNLFRKFQGLKEYAQKNEITLKWKSRSYVNFILSDDKKKCQGMLSGEVDLF